MMNWYDGGLSWGGWLAMTAMMLIFWGGVIVALVALFRGAGDGGPWRRPADRDPQQILDERFARGEIDENEYHARQDVLRETDADPTGPGRGGERR